MTSSKLELTPEQPEEVGKAIAEALAEAGASGAGTGPDPWWQAGLEESLEP